MSGRRVFGVVLAGGMARRMGGGDKALIRLGGESLLTRSQARLSPQVERMAINANGDAARFVCHGLPVLADEAEDRPGPLAGVLAGLIWARSEGATHLISVAVDTPFFPGDLTERLFSAAETAGVPLACAQTGERTHPVFGLWPVSLADDLRHALMEEGLRKVDRWTGRHGCASAVFAVGDFDPFFNVNTPEDLHEAERLLESLA